MLVTGLKGGYDAMDDACDKIKDLEHSGDEVIHALFRKLQATFVTPFDPRTFRRLRQLWTTTRRNRRCVLSDRGLSARSDPGPAIELAQIIDDSCRSLARAVESLKDKKPVLSNCIEVHRLENKADEDERLLVRNLFISETDAISLIKHKELYELLEATTDRCEDVADVYRT